MEGSWRKWWQCSGCSSSSSALPWASPGLSAHCPSPPTLSNLLPSPDFHGIHADPFTEVPSMCVPSSELGHVPSTAPVPQVAPGGALHGPGVAPRFTLALPRGPWCHHTEMVSPHSFGEGLEPGHPKPPPCTDGASCRQMLKMLI